MFSSLALAFTFICALAQLSTWAQGSFHLAVLKYNGGDDRYGNPTSVPNLVRFFNAQPGINPDDGLDRDGFLAMFKPVDDIMNWCTYFGGEAGQLNESVRALTIKENALFAAGMTTKYSDVGSYFPLQFNGIAGSFYDDIFGDLVNPTYDGFLTKFCATWSEFGEGEEKARSITDGVVPGDAVWSDGQQIRLLGSTETLEAQLLAVDGRLLHHLRLASMDGLGSSARLPGILSPAVYLLHLADGRSFKFMVP